MRWLPDPSESSVRRAVMAAVPELARSRIEVASDISISNPEWASATAVVDGSFVVKFAWSEPAARRVRREASILGTLARVCPELRVPRLMGTTDNPVAFVTRLVAGEPLAFHDVQGLDEGERAAVATQLASFLATLHDTRLLHVVRERVPVLETPQPQGTTQAIRQRLPRFLDQRRVELVLSWCDWVDEILRTPSPELVLVHGDLHGFNQVWDPGTWTLRLVADFEVAGPSDPEYDLRYFPALEPTLGLLDAMREHYKRLTDRALDMKRVLAWHIRTALGDALWRSEANVALPGGSTPASYVDDIGLKLALIADLGTSW
jgi:aminoglycoside phosphotransferase (APT) family kinase protein